MNVFEHPLFSVVPFLLVCVAGVFWLLRKPGRNADHKQPAAHLYEDELTATEVLEGVPSTIPLVPNGAVSPASPKPDKKDITLRREETKTRLAVLDELIAKQRARIASARTLGQNPTLLEEQLKVLIDSHEEHFSALKRLLSDFMDDEKGNRGIE